MDDRFLQLGIELTRCRYREECPGVMAGLVVNEPERGVFPRGFHVKPPDASPKEIELVVLGQNPGRCDSFARHLYQSLDKLTLDDQFFEVTNQALIEAYWELPYWKNIGRLLNALWPEGSEKPMLSLEVAYCENAPIVTSPGDATFKYCSSRHLEYHLKALRDDTYVLCVGKVAGKWFARFPGRGRFRWFVADHLSGSRGALGRLVDENTKSLREPVEARWGTILDGTQNGIHLENEKWH
jgi:hypothetical protein